MSPRVLVKRASGLREVLRETASTATRRVAPPWGCFANWSLMVVTALGHYPGSGVDPRQTVDTRVDTGRSVARLLKSVRDAAISYFQPKQEATHAHRNNRSR